VIVHVKTFFTDKRPQYSFSLNVTDKAEAVLSKIAE